VLAGGGRLTGTSQSRTGEPARMLVVCHPRLCAIPVAACLCKAPKDRGLPVGRDIATSIPSTAETCQTPAPRSWGYKARTTELGGVKLSRRLGRRVRGLEYNRYDVRWKFSDYVIK
jgi:hypothetical protein